MYRMVAYRVFDGLPTLRDSEIEELWRKMQDSIYWMNYSGELNCYEEFYDMVVNPYILFFTIYKDNIPVAICWITDTLGRTGEIHFCTFKEVWGRETVSIGKYALSCVGSSYDVLIGRTPSEHKLACKFIQLIGMKKLCVIEGGWYNAYNDETVDCLLTSIDFRGETYGRE